MLDHYFKVPFANGGDKTAIPEATQPDGSVSFTQGFGSDYELPYSNPNSKDVPRDQSNQLSFQITQALKEYQENGVPDWIDPAQNGGVSFPYVAGARVRWTDGGVYVSMKSANTSLPSNPNDWLLESGRLIRITKYSRAGAVINASVNGGANTPSSTWTRMLGTRFAIVRAQGAGGGGAGAVNPTPGNVALGAPGAGGGYGESYFSAATLGASQSIALGAGGNGGVAAGGAGGGVTSFGALMTVGGGGGGNTTGTVALPAVMASTTGSGAVTGANIRSYAGVMSTPSIALANGANSCYGGQGGGSDFGPPTAVNASNANGVHASTDGGGGGGVAILSGGGPANGGNGGNGVIYVYEYA